MNKKMKITFICLEMLLYVTFLSMDLIGEFSSLVKFAGICLCFMAALLIACRGRKKDNYYMLLIMTLTMLADVFLLLTSGAYLVGVLLFCLVQTLYALRLQQWGGKSAWILRGAILIVVWIILKMIGALDALSMAAAYSFVQLTLNAVLAVRLKLGKKRAAFAVGLVLFWGCDFCVGLHNIMGYLPAFPWPWLLTAASFGMWLFYLPAQVLLVLSTEI